MSIGFRTVSELALRISLAKKIILAKLKKINSRFPNKHLRSLNLVQYRTFESDNTKFGMFQKLVHLSKFSNQILTIFTFFFIIIVTPFPSLLLVDFQSEFLEKFLTYKFSF